MLSQVRALLEMIRFSHTLFALPFALLSALLAWQKPGSFRGLDLLGILLCMVFARSAAMAFNRIVDRSYDAINPRTAQRHLPAGRLSLGAVWTFTLVSLAGFIASTLLFLLAEPPNYWPVLLSVPVLIFIGMYSFTKRFTALCHFWLGASLFLAPVAAWIAIRGFESFAVPVCLGLAVLFWVAGFDILYACQDVEFDRQASLASVPARLGIPASLWMARLSHLLMVCWLVGLYFVAAPQLGTIYVCAIVALAGLLWYEHWLVRADDLTRVNQAFFHVNGVISVGLFLVVLLEVTLAR